MVAWVTRNNEWIQLLDSGATKDPNKRSLSRISEGACANCWCSILGLKVPRLLFSIPATTKYEGACTNYWCWVLDLKVPRLLLSPPATTKFFAHSVPELLIAKQEYKRAMGLVRCLVTGRMASIWREKVSWATFGIWKQGLRLLFLLSRACNGHGKAHSWLATSSRRGISGKVGRPPCSMHTHQWPHIASLIAGIEIQLHRHNIAWLLGLTTRTLTDLLDRVDTVPRFFPLCFQEIPWPSFDELATAWRWGPRLPCNGPSYAACHCCQARCWESALQAPWLVMEHWARSSIPSKF